MLLDFKDLAVFEFPGGSSVRHWLDMASLRVAYSDKPGSAARALVDAATAATKGEGNFSVRANLLPIAKGEVTF